MDVVLAGVSHWHAEMHLDAAQACGCSIIGVWDEQPGVAARFAHAHGVPALADFEEIIDRPSRLVVLMGHPRTVPARAAFLVEARVPLILEKPASSSTQQLMEIRDLARRQQAFVAFPMPNRFGPAAMDWSDLARDGRGGTLTHAHFRIVNGPPGRYAADGVPWVTDPSVSGGGALRNLGIHGVDAALSMATGKLSIIAAVVRDLRREAASEDYALAILEDEAGAVFTIEAGYTYAWDKPGGDFEWRIASTMATLIDQGDRAFRTTLHDNSRNELAQEPTAMRYRLFMEDTVRRLESGMPPSASIEDYVAAMSLIDGIYDRGST